MQNVPTASWRLQCIGTSRQIRVDSKGKVWRKITEWLWWTESVSSQFLIIPFIISYRHAVGHSLCPDLPVFMVLTLFCWPPSPAVVVVDNLRISFYFWYSKCIEFGYFISTISPNIIRSDRDSMHSYRIRVWTQIFRNIVFCTGTFGEKKLFRACNRSEPANAPNRTAMICIMSRESVQTAW